MKHPVRKSVGDRMGVVQVQDAWRHRLRIPNYAPGEVARYTRISSSTISRWRQVAVMHHVKPREPLSYLELIEIAVVAAARKAGMKLADVVRAHSYLSREFGEDYPFATIRLKTDGIDMLKEYGRSNEGVKHLLVANMNGQLAWQDFLAQRFHEFEYEQGIASRWHIAGKNRPVVIDPRIRFGAPHIKGIPTWLIQERVINGEDIDYIASDFNLNKEDVDAAIEFETEFSLRHRNIECLN